MKIVNRFTGITEAESQELVRALGKKEAKLDRLTGRAKGEEAVLRVNARRSAKLGSVRISMTLTLRRGVLFVEREHADPVTALDRASEALFEEIRSFRSSAFRERQRRRHKRIAQELELAQPYLEEQAKVSDRESFDSRLRPLLRPLYALAVHEVRDRQISGELMVGCVDPGEVVDEVVARAYEAFRSRTFTPQLKTWLVAAMHAYLDELQESLKDEPAVSSEVRLDDPVQGDDPLNVRALGEDRLEFYQPDEALHFEDVVPDLALADPESQLSAREQMRFVHRSLRELPRQKRQAFLLHADGYDDLEISMIQKRPESEVRRDIESVRSQLLKRLLTTS